MFAILWRFEIKSGREAEFERAYGSDGDWARFFSKGAGFIGVELLRDRHNPLTYVTIDRWEKAEDYAAFSKEHEVEYKKIDQGMGDMMVREEHMGDFDTGVLTFEEPAGPGTPPP